MFVGKVIGTVWSTVKWQETRGLKLLLVRPYHLGDLIAREAAAAGETTAPTAGARDRAATDPGSSAQACPPAQASKAIDTEAVVCVDLLDAGVGDDVIVAFGHAARVAAQEGTGTGAGTGAATGAGSRSASAGEGRFSTGASSFPGRRPASGGVTTVPIDAAVVAIVDRIALARPGT